MASSTCRPPSNDSVAAPASGVDAPRRTEKHRIGDGDHQAVVREPFGADVAMTARHTVRSPLAGTVVHRAGVVGTSVAAADVLLVIESMKMEHEVTATRGGILVDLHVRVGDVVAEGDALAEIDAREAAAVSGATEPVGATALRADLKVLLDRQALLADSARPDAVARRHAEGRRTARENIADLCDAGSFTEYGAFAHAAQEKRRPRDELIRSTPADGMVTGIGSVNGETFGPERSRTVVLAYDATVLAGTQGLRNHQKTDRLLGIAAAQGLPVVLFAEGGGGRPGDVDMPIVAGLHVATFANFARLSGQVPVLAVVAGRCFAGNAALAGCSDLLIATRDANLGMGGPAMIEGGGLGVFAPEQIGPSDVQTANGVIDILVEHEAEAVQVVRRCLGYFQGRLPAGAAHPQEPLRDAIPENQLRAHDMRRVLDAVFDAGASTELGAGHGRAVITRLARLGGLSVAVLASHPGHLGGAIDPDAAGKAARFIRLADAHGLPIVSFIDTPGFMVGPEIEARGQVRSAGQLFIAAAQRRVPWLCVVVRKAYGLGAMALAGGSLHEPLATAAWPTAEFGAMGLEGSVRLGYRKELAAAPDDATRAALFQRLLDDQVERGRALPMAATLEIDTVIDPAHTRAWLTQGLASTGRPASASR
jgi:acetyl-CoA carboxylase carboxyltransferase component/biotin carboxyl carrier protein